MRVEGYEHLAKFTTAEIALPRGDEAPPLFLRYRALPRGTDAWLDEVLPLPQAPRDFMRDARGKVMRDPKDDRPVTFQNEQDVGYRQSFDAQIIRRCAVLFVVALEEDKRVEFETTTAAELRALTKEEAVRAAADGISRELADAGFTDAEVSLVINGSRALAAPSMEACKEARDSFLRKAPHD